MLRKSLSSSVSEVEVEFFLSSVVAAPVLEISSCLLPPRSSEVPLEEAAGAAAEVADFAVADAAVVAALVAWRSPYTDEVK